MPEFNPNRLDLARRRRGMTKGGLAAAAGLSGRILTSYERGEKMPSPLTLVRLSKAVGFPPEFLSGPDLDEPPVEESSFRALSRLTARQRDQALGAGAIALAVSDWIDATFELPAPDVPTYRGIDPETAAEAVREQWGLGVVPIHNMIHTLESHGVRVFSLAEESEEVDAFSFWRGSVPYIFLNTMKSGERSRMDAAHELGHLVLHWRGGPRGRDAEHEADVFGGSFLMPRAAVLTEAPRSASLPDLIISKRRWKVAVSNLAYRMHAVNLISDWQYRSLFIEIGRMGYRRNEPGGIDRETSQVLTKVLGILREEGQSLGTIAQALNIPQGDLDAVVFGLVMLAVEGEGRVQVGEQHAKPDLRLLT